MLERCQAAIRSYMRMHKKKSDLLKFYSRYLRNSCVIDGLVIVDNTVSSNSISVHIT